MARLKVIPLLLLAAACGPAVSPPGAAPSRQPATVRIELPDGARELALTPDEVRAHATMLAVPVERASAALPRAFAEVGLEAGAPSDGGMRLATAPRTLARGLKGVRMSRYLDCGATISTPNADTYAVTLQVTSRLAPGGASSLTRVETLLQASAKPIDTSGDRVSCTSTGELEKRIAEQLQLAAVAAGQ